MKLTYITTIAIATILGLVTTNTSYANFQAATNLNSTTVSSKVAQSNPCAGKANPCAGKANPCAGKSSTTTLHPQFYTEKGVALDGQDVVAYFTQNKLVMGVSQFKHNWGGTTWMFASAANRDIAILN